MAIPTALITGIGGQDGSYLAELLVAKGFRVVGLVRPGWVPRNHNLDGVRPKIEIVPIDLSDARAVQHCLRDVMPDHLYHLAAASFVPDSWVDPTISVEIVSVVSNLLDAICEVAPRTRFVNASSAEIFGNPDRSPQNELTPMRPLTPYAEAKSVVFEAVNRRRESQHIHASSAILFNHESPRRPRQFVTMKIAYAAAAIATGTETLLELGNLESRRDWGAAVDYVEAIHLMALAGDPDDFVVATGRSHSVRDVLEIAFSHVGLDWHDYVTLDQRFVRPAEVDLLIGDRSKAEAKLGWTPTVGFEQLVQMMVDSDLERHS